MFTLMKVCAKINAFYFYFQKVGIINKAINKTGVSFIHFIAINIKWLEMSYKNGGIMMPIFLSIREIASDITLDQNIILITLKV